MNPSHTRDRMVGSILKKEYSARDREFAKSALLDWTMVALAGVNEPVTQAIGKSFSEKPVSTLSFGLQDASCAINATASHALDYDDVSGDMRGHPSACVVAAALEAAHQTQADGARILNAICIGHEVQAILGECIGASHYARGFHTTATFGTFGAMAASAYLHALTRDEIHSAINICATQASGLKEVFGSFLKPAQVGLASQKGYQAIRLVRNGMATPAELNALEGRQGFLATQGEPDDSGATRTYSAISNVLYKYHASCYLTHSMIEALRTCLRERQITPDAIQQVFVRVNPGHDAVCNIQSPRTGLEAKFSLRFLAAMVAHGISTADVASFTDDLAGRQDLHGFAAEKVVIEFDDSYSRNATVRVALSDGSSITESYDVSVAETDPATQWEKLHTKALNLNLEMNGFDARHIADTINGMDKTDSALSHFIKAISNG